MEGIGMWHPCLGWIGVGDTKEVFVSRAWIGGGGVFLADVVLVVW